MPEQEITVPIGCDFSNKHESNRFLRSLWAEMREQFGGLAWFLSAYRVGAKKRIYLGRVTASGLKCPVSIAVSYRRRGVASELHLSGDELPTRDQISQLCAAARTRPSSLWEFKFITSNSSRRPLATTKANRVLFTAGTEAETTVTLRVNGFDRNDALTQAAAAQRDVLSILSVFSNLHFLPSSEPTWGAIPTEFVYFMDEDDAGAEPDAQKTSPLDSAEHTPGAAQHCESDWLEGYPIVEGQVVVGEPALQLVDGLLAETLTDGQRGLLPACRHFQAARELEAKGPYITSADELAMTLYLSALEAAAAINRVPRANCSACGQTQHKIRLRVETLVSAHVSPEAGMQIGKYYAMRSSFLHSGVGISNRAYTGVSNPQLDPNFESHVKQPFSVPLTVLRELTSFCLRRIADELLEGRGEDCSTLLGESVNTS